MPAFTFCDQVITAPSSNPISGHERLSFLKHLQDAAAAPDLFGQARPDKPWLNGCPRVVYLKAAPRVDYTSLRQDLLTSIRSHHGPRHWWLCDVPLLRLPGEKRVTLATLPPNVIAALRMADLKRWIQDFDASPFTSAAALQNGIVILADAASIGSLVLYPDEWLIVHGTDPDELEWLNGIPDRTGRFSTDQSAAIFADRPWPFPGKELADLNESERKQAMLFREVPKWIRAGVRGL